MSVLALVLALTAQAQGSGPERAHAANAPYRAVLGEGFLAGGVAVRLPEPLLRDGLSEEDRRAALKGAVDLPLDDFLRDSVNAPFKLKVRDVPYPGGVVRLVNLWFVVHADLDEIDMDDISGRSKKGGSGEAGNMTFEARPLTDAELKAHSKAAAGDLDRHVLTGGLLLDRIRVKSTNRVVATRTGESIVVASAPATGFEADTELATRWWPIPRPGKPEDPAPPRPYPGAASYPKVSKFSRQPPVLLVESHVAFAEPKAWFDGAPILRSNISLVVQDQVRQLRREVARRRKQVKPGGPPQRAS